MGVCSERSVRAEKLCPQMDQFLQRVALRSCLDIDQSDGIQRFINGSRRPCDLTTRTDDVDFPRMQNGILEIGDVIRIQCAGYQHVGVYVGPRGFRGECVVHNSKAGGVILSTFAEFSGGSQVFVHQKAPGGWFDRQTIAERALSLLGTKYDLLTFNCEHAANFAQRGKAESPQIFAATLIGLILGGIGLIAASKRA